MRARALRRQLLLSTTMLVGVLVAYGGRAHGQQVCTASGSDIFCDGASTETQDLTGLTNGTITTGETFEVKTTTGNGITVTGNGQLSYTDEYDSPLFARYIALYVNNSGDDGSTPGSVTISTNGYLKANTGLYVYNQASGGTSITTYDTIYGNYYGIHAKNYGGAVSITTSGPVTGGDYGIHLTQKGSGAAQITANGDVTGTDNVAIYALNADGSSLAISTAGGTTVYGKTYGIDARNYDSNASVTITANGNVQGGTNAINALNYGTDLTVKTGPSTTVSGSNYGIYARNYGSGKTVIHADGDVYGNGSDAILAQNGTNSNRTGTDLTIELGTGVVTGTRGILAKNYGSGDLTISSAGYIGGGSDNGIQADNYGGDIRITAHDVTGFIGILADQHGTGLLEITTDGNIGGDQSHGIVANNYDGVGLIVTTAAGTAVTGNYSGIYAKGAKADAQLSIYANGSVTGRTKYGIYAYIQYGSDIRIFTGAGSTVAGDQFGIDALNTGTGGIAISAAGDITSKYLHGIRARNYGSSDLFVGNGNGSTIKSGSDGIQALQYGGGTLQIAVYGGIEVNGSNSYGVFAYNKSGTDLIVTTGAQSSINSSNDGVHAEQYGSGVLQIAVDGDIDAGTDSTTPSGIYAQNVNGTVLVIKTGASSTVSGVSSGITAVNSGGELRISAMGDVNSDTGAAIYAFTFSGPVEVATGLGYILGDSGIEAKSDLGGNVAVTTKGRVRGVGGYAINAATLNGDIAISTATGSFVYGATAINAEIGAGSGTIGIETSGEVGTSTGPAISAASAGGKISISVAASSVVSAADSAGTYAVRTTGGATTLAVSGTLKGGTGGAVQFDQGTAFANTLKLRPGAKITGTVFAGPGSGDMLEWGGSGSGTFDLSSIDTGSGTRQYRNFEGFEVKSGTWSFSGSTTAPFSVTGGTVEGTGTFENVVVTGGTVMGTGTFGNLSLLGGTLAPGNSIGTIHVNGGFALASGAVYEVEVNDKGESDKVIVKGTVNLTGATLRVLAENGDYKAKTSYTIIDNDGSDAVKGRFAEIEHDLAFLKPSVVYNGGDGNDVVLTLTRHHGRYNGGGASFCSVANTQNQCNTAKALDKFPTSNKLFLDVLFQTAEGARQAFDALSGEIHATVAGTLARDSRYVREAVLGRLVQASYMNNAGAFAALGAGGPEVASLDGQAMALGRAADDGAAPAGTREPLAFWTHAFGAWADFDSDGNAAAANRNLGGFVSGMDARVIGSWRMGFATGASFSNVAADARYSSAQVESYYLGGYLGGMAGRFALRGGGMWTWSNVDTSRAIVFPGFYERQTATYDADTGQLFGEVAYPTQVMDMALEPFGGFAYVSVDRESFGESGGMLSRLLVGDLEQEVGYSTVGLRLATTMAWGSMQIRPHVWSAWQHAFGDVTPGAARSFAATGIGFTIYGVPLAEDSVLLDAGLDVALGPRTTAGVSYTGQFGDRVSDNGVEGRFTWLF